VQETLEKHKGEIAGLQEQLAASEEARQLEAEELKSQDEELTRLRQLFATVQGQFAAVSPLKPSSHSS
jgi:chromosome segregation ATPase